MGSTPTVGFYYLTANNLKNFFFSKIIVNARLAQLAERGSYTAVVTGSSPVLRTFYALVAKLVKASDC